MRRCRSKSRLTDGLNVSFKYPNMRSVISLQVLFVNSFMAFLRTGIFWSLGCRMTELNRELPTEKQPRAMKSCLDRRHAQPEHHGDFFIGHSLHVAQNDHAFVQGF